MTQATYRLIVENITQKIINFCVWLTQDWLKVCAIHLILYSSLIITLSLSFLVNFYRTWLWTHNLNEWRLKDRAREKYFFEENIYFNKNILRYKWKVYMPNFDYNFKIIFNTQTMNLNGLVWIWRVRFTRFMVNRARCSI